MNIFSHAALAAIKYLVSVIIIISASCASPTKKTLEVKSDPNTHIQGKYVVFPLDSSSEYDKRLTYCIEKNIFAMDLKESSLIHHRIFKDNLMPWFENDRLPKSVESLKVVLSKYLVRERLDSLNIRYLVYIAYKESFGDGIPALYCGAGYGAAGCLGLASFESESNVAAIVWDLKEVTKISEINATASGATIVAGYIIPFGFIAYTEEDACQKMSTGLTNYFSGHNSNNYKEE